MKIWNCFWESENGGPSPDDNHRTELFLKGCRKASEGSPCSGCFNSELWESDPAHTQSPYEVFAHIQKNAPNKYITIVGGEPTDQMEDLTALCRLLHNNGFHVMVFTHHEMATSYDFLSPLLPYIDILIDGPYDETQHIFSQEAYNGFFNAVGSANQIVWDVKEWQDDMDTMEGYLAGYIEGLYLQQPSNRLIYVLKDESMQCIKISTKEANYDKAVGC